MHVTSASFNYLLLEMANKMATRVNSTYSIVLYCAQSDTDKTPN